MESINSHGFPNKSADLSSVCCGGTLVPQTSRVHETEVPACGMRLMKIFCWRHSRTNQQIMVEPNNWAHHHYQQHKKAPPFESGSGPAGRVHIHGGPWTNKWQSGSGLAGPVQIWVGQGPIPEQANRLWWSPITEPIITTNNIKSPPTPHPIWNRIGPGGRSSEPTLNDSVKVFAALYFM